MFILYKIKIVSLLRAQEGEKKNQSSSSLRMRQFSRWCAQQLSLGSLETVSQSVSEHIDLLKHGSPVLSAAMKNLRFKDFFWVSFSCSVLTFLYPLLIFLISNLGLQKPDWFVNPAVNRCVYMFC